MIFKMMMKNAVPEEKSIVRSFITHISFGWLTAFLIGSIAYLGILLTLGSKIDIPPLFALAMLMQAGVAGGFLGSMIFMTRISNSDDSDEEEDHGPKGNAPEAARVVRPAQKPRQSSPSPVSAGGLPAAAWRS